MKESNRKPNKIWVDKGGEFYNNSFKKWLQDNDIVMYSTKKEGKSVIAKRFIRTLNCKIYKCMTSISKIVYIDELDNIVKKYNNAYHTSIKIKLVDIKDNTYIDFKKEINDKNPKFKVGCHVRTSKYKSILLKGICQIGQKKFLLLIKLKILYHGHMFLMALIVKIATVDATKDDIKNITHVDTSSLALKTNLANLRTKVDKLDIDKSATVPLDLSKLSNVVKIDVVKKTVYDKLVAKVNNIDTSDFC